MQEFGLKYCKKMMKLDNYEFDVFFDSSDSFTFNEPVLEQDQQEIKELNSQVLLSDLQSVRERRERFIEKMGLFEINHKNTDDKVVESTMLERIRECHGASSSSLTPSEDESEESSSFCSRDRSCGSNLIGDEDSGHENVNQSVVMEDLGLGSSFSAQDCENCEAKVCGNERKKKKTKRWLKSFIDKIERRKRISGIELQSSKSPVTRVKVHRNKKNLQELSAVYNVGEIQGHDGFIWAMKFSPDGKYLASGGEDGVVRIWQVGYANSSFRWFNSIVGKDSEDGKFGYGGKRLNKASVLLPEKIFHIDEEPVLELRGHSGAVLDLAWSISNRLLSASTDKTVQLWQVGSHQCLGVFQHNNYVTCVQFDPTDENYFLSGCIDGKARIWGLSDERVVSWADIQDAVSAVCYQPDGKGIAVGSLAGTCHLYETSGNDVQLKAKIRVQGRKKTSANKINGIQFYPDKPSRLMITSDDSRLRVFDSVKLVQKLKGLPKSGGQASASFTSSGKHIVSVGQDHRVYLWNYHKHEAAASRKRVKSRRSCEYFSSESVSVAVPWPGTTMLPNRHLRPSLPTPRPTGGRVSATWPEEKLRNQEENDGYGELRELLPEAWGLVVVTAGWDGIIRTFHNYGLPVEST